MRVRLLGLRLLATTLTLLWGVAAALVLVGYRPGGPIDLLVGGAAALTIPVAAVGLRWPPLARGDVAAPAIAWIGIGSVLLLVPSVAGLAGTVAARGPRTLLPSLEAGYPWLLALLGTACFSGIGLAQRRLGAAARRRDRLRLGGAYALAAALVVGGAFTASAAGNDLALAGRVTADSRFGPVAGPAAPPPCDGPLAAGERIAAEDRGVSVVEGARARHCRVAIDGPTFADAFPEVGWFLAPGSDLSTWRGELDYWVFLDGQLGRLSGSVGGAAVDAGLRGIRAELAVALDAYDRDLTLVVVAPR